MKTKTKIAGITGLASLAWLGVTAAMALNQRKLVFNPSQEPEAPGAKSAAHKTRAVVLRGRDGTRLSGWFLTPDVAGPHPAVIYFGGRSEEVSWVVRDAGRLFPNMAVLVLNYRGYGQSLGQPSEQQMVDDGEVMFDWLLCRTHVDTKRIAVVGRSLGSGVAVQLGVRRPVHSLVLVTPYDSILAIARKRARGVPVGLILKHRFESDKHGQKLKVPIYVLRAAEDTIVPHVHTDSLVSKLASLYADETIPESDHCNIPYLPETQSRIAAYLGARFGEPPVPILAKSA
jgi:pimeloyl-ACP methyl ester carboxylesterase